MRPAQAKGSAMVSEVEVISTAGIEPVKRVLSDAIDLDAVVVVAGWVRSRRTSKAGFSFIELHDGSCFSSIQVVVDQNLRNYDEVLELTTGASLKVLGQVVESQGRNQSREIQASQVEVVGVVSEPDSYPISKKRHSFEFLRSVAHLRPRTNTFGAIARLRNGLAQAVHQYFQENGFLWVNTPIITASDCEGAGELFRVSTLETLAKDSDFSEDFFGTEAFLTVSGQLNVEAFCCALSRVYTFGPTFRAENSNTSRHLAEFWMIEPELAFAELAENAALAESFLKSVFNHVLEFHEEDLRFFAERIDTNAISRLENLVEQPFERMEYSDAIEILLGAKREFEFEVAWGKDLQSEHERYLTEEHVGRPVIVMNYPRDIKAFYMRLNDDERTVAAMDVLVPGVGEIIGGSQREERLDVLDARIGNPALAEQLWWYRDLRRYGTVPHSGFGLGFERLVLYVSGMENIRDAIPFPRVPNNASF